MFENEATRYLADYYARKYMNYSNYLAFALWASLAGYEEMRACYTFEGEVEVVTGWTNEPLFQGEGLSDIKKPTTKKITLKGSDGYEIRNTASRYYALAFLQAINTLGWFSKDAETATVSHTDAQGKFIFGGMYNNPKIGMIIEGSYWWNETEEKAANISTFFDETDKTERNIAVMSLPTSLNGPRPKEGVVNELTLVDFGAAYCAMNSNIAHDEAQVKAAKAFLKFMYSDKQLEEFTKCTSANIAMIDYPISDAAYEGMDYFSKSLQNITKRSNNAKVVYAVADNPTFLASAGTFRIYQWNALASPNINNIKYDSFLSAIRRNIDLKTIFEAGKISAAEWEGLYLGE